MKTKDTLDFSSDSTRKLTEESKDQENEQDLLISKNAGKLSIVEKICFAMGGLPYQMCGNALGLFISPFLLEIAGLRPKQVSIVLFSGKGWDAVTDPLIGFFVNKTNTRFGKLRPWILFSTPFALISYMMIWYVPSIDRESKTFWYLVFYCLFQTFLSCLHVPYTSLTMYLTPCQAERDSATGYRMAFEVFGVLLAAGIQGAMITIFGSSTKCNITNETSNLTFFKRDYGENSLDVGYLSSAALMSFIYFICSLATFFGTTEMKDVITDKNTNFFRSLKSVFRHKSYITLLLTFMFSSLAIQLVQSNLALYCKYSVTAKDEYQFIIIVLLVTTVVSLPFWQFIMLRFGKKTTYAIGLSVLLPNLIALYFLTNEIWAMYLIATLCGLAISVSFLLPWSMIPDVIDEFMINTGERKESIFYSFYVFFTKFSSGISVALSALLLEYADYNDCPNGCCVQPPSVGDALRLLVVPGPILMICLALFLLWLHPINEKRRLEIKETLIKIRDNANKEETKPVLS